MATTIVNFNHQYLLSNLDTYNYTVNAAGTHLLSVKLTDIASPAGLSIVLKQNGSTLITSITPAVSTNEINVNTMVNCAVNDTLTVVVTSTTASDVGPNKIRGFILLQGGV